MSDHVDRLNGGSIPPSGFEKFFVASVLLISTGAFANLWVEKGSVTTQDVSSIGLVVTALIYFVTLVLLNRHCKGVSRLFLREWPLAAFSTIVIFSALWSSSPGISLRHGVALLFTIIFGLYMSVRFSLKEQLRLFASVFGICVAFSFIFGIFGWGTSVDAGDGVPGWYGVFVQKNSLGQMMVLSVMVFLLWKKAEPEYGWVGQIGFLGSLLLVVLSQSATSMIAVVLVLLLLPYLRWTARSGQRRLIAGLTVLAVIGAFSLTYVLTHLPETTDFLGRDATMTGRLPLWIYSTVMALQRPWLGYGYDAFWMQDQGGVAIQRAAGWAAPHAHNGFLEIWLELGLAGLAIFICGFSFYVFRAIRFFMQQRRPETIWPLLYLAIVFLMSITSVILLYRHSIFMVLYSALSLSTAPKFVEITTDRSAVA